MMYKLKTAKEFYHEEKDREEISHLQSLGFSFEDWGGFLMIKEGGEVYVSDNDWLGQFLKRFGGLEMTRDGEIQINNFSVLPSYVGDGE